MEALLAEQPDSQEALAERCLQLEDALASAASVDCFEDLADFAILDLRGEGLSALPESFGLLEALQGVSLSDNQLTSLPESIGQLRQLEELKLSNNRLQLLPKSLGELRGLEELDLATNFLSYVPHVAKLRGLVKLSLAGNCLAGDALPHLGRLQRLQRLDVSVNQLESLPDSITQLRSLEILCAHTNQLNALPGDLGHLSKLQDLDVRYNALSELPESVCSLASLTSLSVSGNALQRLPDGVEHLVTLRNLSLAQNHLLDLPPLWRLRKLEMLDLQDNLALTSVLENRFRPAVLDRCSSSLELAALLKFGALRDLRLGTVDSKPELLKMLETDELDLCSMQLRWIPPDLGGLKLLKLKARQNQLQALSAKLCRFQRLQVLDLYSNQLTGLPAEIGNLKSLTELDVSSNLLLELPPSLGDLSCLVRLEAGKNKLSDLPSSLTKLSCLSTLGLRLNPLETLPEKLDELQALKVLDLGSTPLGKSLQLPQQGHCPVRRRLYLMHKYDALRSIKLCRSQPSSLPEDFDAWGRGPPPKPPPASVRAKCAEKDSAGYHRFFGSGYGDEDMPCFASRRSAVEEAGDNMHLRKVLLDIEAQIRRVIPGRLEAAASRQKLFRTLCRQWHPDKRRDDPELATRVFQWLQTLK
ncbi:unnamed protein product [Effrenium voratum]|uniref:Disease resistance R13L4/SHOC-2-like LRR domain-containing protein n=1 Tax=Effrenium voratum TaxID=2562239 RepID=A0AA36IHX7_9DINO|nr:unnamed protein product [Effrenium voratum]CAJ1426976.1 unnamed protein product [Effrenium voratum]